MKESDCLQHSPPFGLSMKLLKEGVDGKFFLKNIHNLYQNIVMYCILKEPVKLLPKLLWCSSGREFFTCSFQSIS